MRSQSLIEAYSISSIHFTIHSYISWEKCKLGLCSGQSDCSSRAGTQEPWSSRGWVSKYDIFTISDTHSEMMGYTVHNIINIVRSMVYTAQYMLKL